MRIARQVSICLRAARRIEEHVPICRLEKYVWKCAVGGASVQADAVDDIGDANMAKRRTGN